MRRNAQLLACLSALTMAAAAALAPAASALSGSGSLTPNTPKKVTTLKLKAASLPTEGTLPSAMTITLQKGFAGIVGGSATSFCTPVQAASPFGNQCPAASQIGSGTEVVTPTPALFGATGAITLGLSFYMVPAQQAGCSASVAVIVKVLGNDALLAWSPGNDTGNLCPHAGGVQLSFPGMPTYAYKASGSTMTINSLSIKLGTTAGAVTGPFKSPASCPKARKWTGSLALAFGSPHVNLPLTFACR